LRFAAFVPLLEFYLLHHSSLHLPGGI